jgi:hypothetical protein
MIIWHFVRLLWCLWVAFGLVYAENDNRHRLIVTHHKTGTMLARKLKFILSDLKVNKLTRQYSIATIGDGLHEIGLNPQWTNVVHLMRNPFSMIISSYYYHQMTTESWVHCQIANPFTNPICPFKSKYITVQNTLKYIHEDLDGHLNLTAFHRFQGNGNGQQQQQQKTIYKFPKVGHHTYQTYLKSLTPIQGVITEMIRVNFHDIPSMIEDFLLMEKMKSYYSLPNTYPLHLTRSFHSVCLESLTSVSKTGQVMNSEEGLRRILGMLDIAVPEEDMAKISGWVNRGTEAHQTNHTSSSRGQVESLLRWFDHNHYDGLLHKYEKMINCGGFSHRPTTAVVTETGSSPLTESGDKLEGRREEEGKAGTV